MDDGAAVLDLGGVGLPLDSRRVFGGPFPIEIELGAGKGRFLLEWAAMHPEVGLIGVERTRKYLDLGARRAARRGLANVRFVHTTAEDLLFRCLAPGTVAAAHVYFPDPWPKKRHHKRRFFHPENVARLAEVLEVGGLLRIKTDHGGYAAVIADVVAAERRLGAAPADGAFEGIPATNFEIKYAREARPVHRLAYRKL